MTAEPADLVEFLRTRGARLSPGASESDITLTSGILQSWNRSGIPPDHARLLAATDGVRTRHYTLLPTGAGREGHADGWDILSATLRAAEDEAIDDAAIVLGHLPGGLLLTYQPPRGRYVVLDTPPYDALGEYDGIEAFLRHWPRDTT